MIPPVTLEGRVAWLLGIVSLTAGIVGVVLAFRHGAEGFQAMAQAKLLFPFALLTARWTGAFWDLPIFVVFLQFPLYAIALTIGVARERLRPLVAIVALVHVAAVIGCLLLV